MKLPLKLIRLVTFPLVAQSHSSSYRKVRSFNVGIARVRHRILLVSRGNKGLIWRDFQGAAGASCGCLDHWSLSQTGHLSLDHSHAKGSNCIEL